MVLFDVVIMVIVLICVCIGREDFDVEDGVED